MVSKDTQRRYFRSTGDATYRMHLTVIVTVGGVVMVVKETDLMRTQAIADRTPSTTTKIQPDVSPI